MRRRKEYRRKERRIEEQRRGEERREEQSRKERRGADRSREEESRGEEKVASLSHSTTATNNNKECISSSFIQSISLTFTSSSPFKRVPGTLDLQNLPMR